MQRSQIEQVLADISGINDRDRAYVAGLVIGALKFTKYSSEETIKKLLQLVKDDTTDGISGDKTQPIQKLLLDLTVSHS